MFEFLILFLLVLLALSQPIIHNSKFISPLLSTSLTFYLFFWIIFPILYSILMPERTNEIIFNLTYQKLIIIQLFSVWSILIMLYIFPIFFPSLKRRFNPRPKNANPNLIILLLFIALFFLIITQIYSIHNIGFGFLDRIGHVVSDKNREDRVGPFLYFFNSFIIPFAIACIFSRIPYLQYKPIVRHLSILIIIIHIAFMLIYGVRSAIVLPPILFVIYWKVFRPKCGKLYKTCMVLSILIFLIIFPALADLLGTVRLYQSYGIRDLFIRPAKSFSSIGEYCLDSLDEIYLKFSSLENGAYLLETEGTSRVGLSLIMSSLVSPIPRLVYPEKPVPFSINKEYSGIPYYLVPRLKGYVFPGNVVPVAPSAIALWELGYAGIFIMIVFNFTNLLLINYFLKSELLFYRTLGFFMLSMPTFEFLVSPTGLIIKEGLRILLLIFLFKFLIIRATRKVLSLKVKKTYLNSTLSRISH